MSFGVATNPPRGSEPPSQDAVGHLVGMLLKGRRRNDYYKHDRALVGNFESASAYLKFVDAIDIMNWEGGGAPGMRTTVPRTARYLTGETALSGAALEDALRSGGFNVSRVVDRILVYLKQPLFDEPAPNTVDATVDFVSVTPDGVFGEFEGTVSIPKKRTRPLVVCTGTATALAVNQRRGRSVETFDVTRAVEFFFGEPVKVVYERLFKGERFDKKNLKHWNRLCREYPLREAIIYKYPPHVFY